MQEDDRVPLSDGDVTHRSIEDVYTIAGMMILGRDDSVRHGIAPSWSEARKTAARSAGNPRYQRALRHQVRTSTARLSRSDRRSNKTANEFGTIRIDWH
jgi:hypothetical protein